MPTFFLKGRIRFSMSRELINVIEQISREKGIKGNVILEAVKAALLSAAKKRYGVTDNLQVEIDAKSGQIQVILIKKIVEVVTNPKEELSLEEARTMDEEADIGDEIGAVIEVGDFGRIAAQAAKQVIFQKVREAEWDAVYKDFIDRQGELVHGVILGQENRNYIVDLGKTEGLLPVKEQIPRETFKRGDRIKAYLLEVKPSAKGPQLILSRSHPNFVSKLFATEVPEIYERIVEIKDVVREPGDRTKISVFSKDSAVDPVGACVGMKGSRVQAVVRELRGEKIDIIPWSEDPRVFIAKALSPSVVEKVGVTEEDRSALAVVADSQLSLAIGKKGQNVRLAAKLTGWKIDILSESEYDQERQKEREHEIEAAIAEETRKQAAETVAAEAADAQAAAPEAPAGPAETGPGSVLTTLEGGG